MTIKHDRHCQISDEIGAHNDDFTAERAENAEQIKMSMFKNKCRAGSPDPAGKTYHV